MAERVTGSNAAGAGRRAVVEVKKALRDTSLQLSLLGNHAARTLALRDTDLECLDLIIQEGGLQPGELARRTSLRPATVTGVLDRLEGDGWVVRTRDDKDRRAVVVTGAPTRGAELFAAFADMDSAMDRLCREYTVEELAVVTAFLQSAATAARASSERLDAHARGG